MIGNTIQRYIHYHVLNALHWHQLLSDVLGGCSLATIARTDFRNKPMSLTGFRL